MKPVLSAPLWKKCHALHRGRGIQEGSLVETGDVAQAADDRRFAFRLGYRAASVALSAWASDTLGDASVVVFQELRSRLSAPLLAPIDGGFDVSIYHPQTGHLLFHPNVG
jgi:hypothetical protein